MPMMCEHVMQLWPQLSVGEVEQNNENLTPRKPFKQIFNVQISRSTVVS